MSSGLIGEVEERLEYDFRRINQIEFLQDGPLLDIKGVVTPINGPING